MIRELIESDIDGLNALPPLDWKYNFESFIRTYISEDYFYAFVMIQSEQVIGTGNVFLKGKTGWLANIITSKQYRGKGFGTRMTKFLVEFLKSKQCETQLLIATELGESVYKKVGFNKISEYRSFETEEDNNTTPSNLIRQLKHSDLDGVIKMDQEINDEDRVHFIKKHYNTGHGYFNRDNELLGFYLPDFGRGLILSKHNEVGIELLKLKHSKKGQKTLLPIENTDGINFLRNNGLKEGMTCSRMLYGKENNWNPEFIFSYAGGYCG